MHMVLLVEKAQTNPRKQTAKNDLTFRSAVATTIIAPLVSME